MKLTDRYKFLEPVAGGKVSTFLARDSSSGKRVLVHIFKSQPLGTGQPSALSVLEMFRRLAPNPPGLVLQAGTDEKDYRAYIIAEVPAAVALQEWVRLYKLHSNTTQTNDAEAEPGVLEPSSEFSIGSGGATTVPLESIEGTEGMIYPTKLSAFPMPAPSDSGSQREAPEKLPEAGADRAVPFGASSEESADKPGK